MGRHRNLTPALETKVTTMPPHSRHGMGGRISPCYEEEAEEVMAADMVSLRLGWREGRIWTLEDGGVAGDLQ